MFESNLLIKKDLQLKIVSSLFVDLSILFSINKKFFKFNCVEL